MTEEAAQQQASLSHNGDQADKTEKVESPKSMEGHLQEGIPHAKEEEGRSSAADQNKTMELQAGKAMGTRSTNDDARRESSADQSLAAHREHDAPSDVPSKETPHNSAPGQPLQSAGAAMASEGTLGRPPFQADFQSNTQQGHNTEQNDDAQNITHTEGSEQTHHSVMSIQSLAHQDPSPQQPSSSRADTPQQQPPVCSEP